MVLKDILLDEDFKPIIKNGDFVIGESKEQEVRCIIKLNQGQLKLDPLLGPSLIRLLNAPMAQTKIAQRIKMHLKRDLKDNIKVRVENGVIKFTNE